MVNTYIGNIDNYSKTDKLLAFFSYIVGSFGNNIDNQPKNIIDTTGINVSVISVSNLNCAKISVYRGKNALK
ncbi:MAG: hypothetical protein K2N34_08670 [Lachnospiraceae bacterium]|nr:hypothetical protein [Lachnospiraceae bacterium]